MEKRKSIALSFITLLSHIATYPHPSLPINALVESPQVPLELCLCRCPAGALWS